MSTFNPFDPEAIENRPLKMSNESAVGHGREGSNRTKHTLSSSTSRQPLGASTTTNMQHGKTHTRTVCHEGDAIKVKKAMDEVIEQRRKRAEAEGIAQGARKDAVQALEQIAHLRRQLDKAQARIAKRDETIASLSSRTSDDKLEHKLEDLVNRYQASKTKYQTELENHQKTNTILRSTLDILEKKHDRQTSQISDLRKANTLAENENAELKKENETLRSASAGTSKRGVEFEKERQSWKTERKQLEEVIGDLKEQMESVAQEGSNEIEIISQGRENLEDLLASSAIACCRISLSSIPKEDYRRLEEEKLELQLRLLRADGRVSVLSSALGQRMEEKRELDLRLAEARSELSDAESRLSELSADNQELRTNMAEMMARPSYPVESNLLDACEELAMKILDLALNHVNLLSTYLDTQVTALNTELHSTTTSLSALTTTLETSETSLKTLQTSHKSLQAHHEELRKAHEPCSAREADLRADVIRANQAEADAKTEVREVEDEIKRVEERARLDRESLKRVNEAGLRWEAAKTAMEEEVDNLRTALTQAYEYESLYTTLLSKHTLLETQYALSSQETNQLIHQNSLLLGHNNADQKLNYIETMRREMVALKNELASTRIMLNDSVDRVGGLEEEVEAYKGVSGGVGIGEIGVGRRRVVRRQQEGSRLTLSSSTRSVSGPAGR